MRRLAASLSLVCTLGISIGCRGADEVTGLGAPGDDRRVRRRVDGVIAAGDQQDQRGRGKGDSSYPQGVSGLSRSDRPVRRA